MSTTLQTQNLASDLINLAKQFQSSEPGQAADLKRAFKGASKNDLARTTVYLMEVVGVSDMRIKQLQEEVKDLKELCKLNNIETEDKTAEESSTTGTENNV